MEPRTVAAVAVMLAVASTAPFPVSGTGADQTEPVSFESTTAVGISDRIVATAETTPLAIPRSQAYFTQYRYVVGYYGVTSLVASLQRKQEREFGRVLALYVSDFSGTNPTLSDEGYLQMEPDSTDWVPARDAYFVVNSSARIPSRERVFVPFSDREDALTFANQYGGSVRQWDAVKRQSVGRLGRSREQWRATVRERRSQTSRAVRQRSRLLDRPVSVVVGRNSSSVESAIKQAPPNTTVLVPNGTYRVDDLRIRKPVTLRGAGSNRTQLIGDENGSVISVSQPRVAIADLAITGVGGNRSGNNRTVDDASVPQDSWKYRFYRVHGYGDAAIVFDSADESYVADLRINTTSNGVIARNSRGLVVTDLTLYGTKRWEDGFIGVVALGEPVVVQDSQFFGGKVGVYTFDTTGVAVRNTTMEGMMLGVFDLFSARLYAANNTISDVWAGIYVHDRVYGSTVVGNTVHDGTQGIIVEGQASYVSRNVLLHNGYGMYVYGYYSTWTENVFAYNRFGARSSSLLPTNQVTANDFVGNGRYVRTQRWNVLHVWAGNYWRGAPGRDADGDGYLSRPFRPTGPVDGRVTTANGAQTLARSPAVAVLRELQRLLPGLQSANVVDPRPRARPVRSERVRELATQYSTVGTHEDDDPWDYHPEE